MINRAKLSSDKQSVTSREKILDSIRGIAIVGVVLFHSSIGAQEVIRESGELPSSVIFDITNLGAAGVQLFFILSGYLLAMGSFQKKFEVKSYVARRFARIYPLWIIAVIFYLLANSLGWGNSTYSNLSKWVDLNFSDSSAIVGYAVLFVIGATFTGFIDNQLWNGIVPGGWSIQVEVAHYAIFPFIRNRPALYFVKFVSIINVLTIGIYWLNSYLDLPTFEAFSNAWMRLPLYNSLLFFLGGVVIYRSFSENFALMLELRQIPRIWYGVLLLSLLFSPFGFVNFMLEISGIVLLLAACFLLIQWLSLEKVMRKLGKFSYSMYFVHFVVIKFLSETDLCKNLFDKLHSQFLILTIIFVCTLALSASVAYVTWTAIEAPIIRKAKKGN